MGDESFRPDRLGVMIHISGVMLGKREVGQMDLFEVNEGAMDQPYIVQLIEENKAVGFIIVTHHIQTANTYERYVMMSRDHFTDSDVALFQSRMQE